VVLFAYFSQYHGAVFVLCKVSWCSLHDFHSAMVLFAYFSHFLGAVLRTFHCTMVLFAYFSPYHGAVCILCTVPWCNIMELFANSIGYCGTTYSVNSVMVVSIPFAAIL
jgi:hypothetical protein